MGENNNTYKILKSVLSGGTILTSINNSYEILKTIYDETNEALKITIDGGINSLSGLTETQINEAISEAIAGGVYYQGGFDAATNTPNLTGGTGILKGYMYVVTVAGTFFGEILEIGDVIIAEKDTPNQLSDWTIVQKNFNLEDYYLKTECDNNFLSASTSFYTQIECDANFLSANTSFYTQSEADANFLSANTALFDGSYTSLSDVPDFDTMYLSANTSFYTQSEADANFLSISDIISGDNIEIVSGLTDITISAKPTGSDTYIQFNDSDVFGGSQYLTFNKTLKSLQTGENTITGNYNFAAGYGNNISGNYSVCFGYENLIKGNNSLSIGNDNFLYATNSFLGGYNSILGTDGFANGANSIGFGSNIKVLADNSQCFGLYTKTLGDYSFAAGQGFSEDNEIITSGSCSFNFSQNTKEGISGATGDNSVILGGIDNTASGKATIMIGCNEKIGTKEYTLYTENHYNYSSIYRNCNIIDTFIDDKYDLLSTDYIIIIDSTSATTGVTINIPTAQLEDNRIIKIKDSGLATSKPITILCEGGEFIDGSSTAVIDENYNSLSIIFKNYQGFII
jgi:hypothetical protein